MIYIMNFDIKDLEINTDRLFLRPLKISDVPYIFETAQQYPEITKFMTWSPPKEIAETRQFFEDTNTKVQHGKLVRWAIYSGKEFCGIIGIEDICRNIGKWQVDEAEMGYWLSPAFQGRGFMLEAVPAILGISFGKLGLHKVKISYISANVKSAKVIEKSGFRHVGTAKKHLFDREKWWDLEWYEMLSEDFLAQK